MKSNFIFIFISISTITTLFSCQKKQEENRQLPSNKKADSLVSSNYTTKEPQTTFQKKVTYQNISFVITLKDTTLTIQPNGFSEDNSLITKNVDGIINTIEIEDVNTDGSPELLIYITNSGSGSYGTAIGFSGNNNKSVSEISIPSIIENPKANKGYLGHDEFKLIVGTLIQRFPIYKEGDTNSNPTGGTRQIQYKLKNGETSKIFVIDKIIEY